MITDYKFLGCFLRSIASGKDKKSNAEILNSNTKQKEALRNKIKFIEGGAKDSKPAAFRGNLRLLSCLSSVIQDHRTRGNPKDASML